MTAERAGTLLSIRALARAGATELAWQLFQEAGLDRVEDDDAVLTLRGRLLKDRALNLSGAARRKAALAAADAYRAAAAIRTDTYPLINAATLSLIGGSREAAEAAAREVLALLDAGGGEPDTPYYMAATRAEALLLLQSPEEATAALAGAIQKAPEAWEDHASTLRQFRVILDALGLDAAWLDAYRPPRTLHFAGRMGEDDQRLIHAIDCVLAQENVGFGYGSLAAGADIMTAERILARGAELHVVLPFDRTAFIDHSVRPYGADWCQRFDTVIAQAASVTEAGDGAEQAGAIAIELADEIAMGQAAMQALVLQTESIQLLTGPLRQGSPSGHNSARVGQIWTSAGRRQHLLDTAQTRGEAGAASGARNSFRLVAIVAVGLTDQLTPEPLTNVAHRLSLMPRLPDRIAPPQWRSHGVTLAFASPTEAAAAALKIRSALQASGPVRVAAHFGLVAVAPSFSGSEGPAFLGETLTIAELIVSATPSTAVYVSEQFAAALMARGTPACMPEFVGELGKGDTSEAVALYTLNDPSGISD